MKPQVRHFGKIVNGKRSYYNLELHHQQLLALEGKEFEEVIKERVKKITISQHNYYRGAILPTCHQSEMFCHYDNKDEIHDEYFSEKFLKYVKMANNPDGTKTEKIKYRSLSDLNRKEMSDFIEKVIADCDLNGIIVLSPESYYNKLYDK